MDEIVLPFTMRATVTHGGPPPEPLPDVLPPGWVKIPITMQIRLSAAMADHLFHGGPAPGPEDGPDYDTIRNSMHMDFDHADLGEFTPEEVAGWFDALPEPAETLAERNIRELATLIWSEARGAGDEAMTAVGWTVRNRMIRNRATKVDKAWDGYSYGTRPHGGDLTRTEAIARHILDGNTKDPTNGATYFYSPSTMPKENATPKELADKKMDLGDGLESVPGAVDKARQ